MNHREDILIDNYLSKKELNLPENKTILFCLQNIKKLSQKYLDVLLEISKRIENCVILPSEIWIRGRNNRTIKAKI